MWSQGKNGPPLPSFLRIGFIYLPLFFFFLLYISLHFSILFPSSANHWNSNLFPVMVDFCMFRLFLGVTIKITKGLVFCINTQELRVQGVVGRIWFYIISFVWNIEVWEIERHFPGCNGVWIDELNVSSLEVCPCTGQLFYYYVNGEQNIHPS